MKVLLDGTLNQSLGLKDLLTGIFQAEAAGLTLLKFSIANKEWGNIYFLDGNNIVYASAKDNVVLGMEALSESLQLKEADFVYVACDSPEALPKNDNIKIDVKQLIENWQLQNEIPTDDLMDKIFSTGPALPASRVNMMALPEAISNPSSENPVVQETTAQDQSSSNPVVSDANNFPVQEANASPRSGPGMQDLGWILVEPLLSDGAPNNNVSGAAGDFWSAGNIPADPRATQKMRAMSHNTQRVQGRRKLRSIVLLLVVWLAIGFMIACGLWWILNAPSLRMTPRHYALPVERHTVEGAGSVEQAPAKSTQ